MRRTIVPAALLAGVLAFQAGPRLAPAQGPDGIRRAEPPTAPAPDDKDVPSFVIPVAVPAEPRDATGERPALPCETGRPLPINLATALRLADARPVII